MQIKILSVEPKVNAEGQEIVVEYSNNGTVLKTETYTFLDAETLNPKYIKSYLRKEARKLDATDGVNELKKLVGKVITMED